VQLKELEPQGHETNPPARYTEATLVRTMEELGIGRPSTYASILGTILDRGYVFKKGTALVPSFLAFSVVQLLEQHFGRLVDYDFTARMEDDLDRIASGDEQRNEWLSRFYYGVNDANGDNDGYGLKELVSDLGGIDAREINRSRSATASCSASAATARTSSVTASGRTFRTISSPTNSRSRRRRSCSRSRRRTARLVVNPETGREVLARNGRYGPYVTEAVPEGSKEKPPTASIFKSMNLDTITFEEALQLLQASARDRSSARTARRSSRGTAATARTCSKARSRARSRRRSSF